MDISDRGISDWKVLLDTLCLASITALECDASWSVSNLLGFGWTAARGCSFRSIYKFTSFLTCGDYGLTLRTVEAAGGG